LIASVSDEFELGDLYSLGIRYGEIKDNGEKRPKEWGSIAIEV
jgi:hypothetical protein